MIEKTTVVGTALVQLDHQGTGSKVRFLGWGIPPKVGDMPRALVQLEGAAAHWCDPSMLWEVADPALALSLLPLLAFALRLALPGRTYWAALDLTPSRAVLHDCGHRHASRKFATLCALGLGPTVCVVRWARTGLVHFSDAESAVWLTAQDDDPAIVRLTRAWMTQRVLGYSDSGIRFRDGSAVGDVQPEAPNHGTLENPRDDTHATDEDHADARRAGD